MTTVRAVMVLYLGNYGYAYDEVSLVVALASGYIGLVLIGISTTWRFWWVLRGVPLIQRDISSECKYAWINCCRHGFWPLGGCSNEVILYGGGSARVMVMITRARPGNGLPILIKFMQCV